MVVGSLGYIPHDFRGLLAGVGPSPPKRRGSGPSPRARIHHCATRVGQITVVQPPNGVEADSVCNQFEHLISLWRCGVWRLFCDSRAVYIWRWICEEV